jgi:hypothetical protein
MIAMEAGSSFNAAKIQAAADRMVVRNLRKAAFSLRVEAWRIIKPASPGAASAPGEPVHTRSRGIIKRGRNAGKHRPGQVQRAIVYDVDAEKQDAVIGPRYSFVGLSMNAHEFGNEFHGQSYPERPTMGPALDNTLSTFGESFANSLGE